MGQTIYVGMAVGSHVTTATASATFSHVALNGQVSDPATLNLQDIGSPALAGSTQYNPTTGTYTISGSGANIWDASDQLRYASQSMTGDGTIIARVSSMNSTRSFAKAGLMIRDSADPGAAQVMVTLLGTQGTGLYYRSATGGTSANILTGDLTQQAPVWLKLVRSGNTFTGYKSSDGVNWTSLGSTTVQMGSTVQVGLAVCSHDISSLATAQFDNVQLS
jgi:regulation of enolase protein 1 (concanavalin A-like superfamily)